MNSLGLSGLGSRSLAVPWLAPACLEVLGTGPPPEPPGVGVAVGAAGGIGAGGELVRPVGDGVEAVEGVPFNALKVINLRLLLGDVPWKRRKEIEEGKNYIPD